MRSSARSPAADTFLTSARSRQAVGRKTAGSARVATDVSRYDPARPKQQSPITTPVTIRIGGVPYGVGAPLLGGLDQDPDVDLVLAPPPEMIPALRAGKLTPTRVMIRGDFRRPGDSVNAAFPKTINTTKSRPVKGTRTELAAWLTHPKNAPALRLAANRLWQQHFGRPLATPEDFGTQGQPPTHPALLDWLATELPRQKWSLKAMHKFILTSATWKQASLDAGNDTDWKRRIQADPDNRLWSRQDRRRLTGEMLRDTLLFSGGELNRQRGGPGVRPPLPKEITSTLLRNQWPVSPKATDHRRRSIYIFARRNLRFPIFDLFDRPAGAESCSRRMTSTTAPQSLALLNSEFVRQSATQLSERAKREADTIEKQITCCYLHTLNRKPTDAELVTARKLTGANGKHLEDLCLGLYNLSEFVCLD